MKDSSRAALGVVQETGWRVASGHPEGGRTPPDGPLPSRTCPVPYMRSCSGLPKFPKLHLTDLYHAACALQVNYSSLKGKLEAPW